MRHKKDPPFALHFFLSPAFFNTAFRLGVGVHEKIEEMVGRSGSPALYGDYLAVYPTFFRVEDWISPTFSRINWLKSIQAIGFRVFSAWFKGVFCGSEGTFFGSRPPFFWF